MSITALFTKTCTIVSRVDSGTTDIYGNQVDTTSTTDVACALQQISRTEEGGTLSSTAWRVYLPTGTALGTDDAIIESGVTYEVAGEPWDATEGTPDMYHVEATLRRVSGGED